MSFGVRWTHGPLHYISAALSTLEPAASPRLSYVHLSFSQSPTSEGSHSRYDDLDNDIQRIADELTRIEREYKGVVSLCVFRGRGFAMLDIRNVRLFFHFRGVDEILRSLFIHCHSSLAGPSVLESFGWLGYSAVIENLKIAEVDVRRLAKVSALVMVYPEGCEVVAAGYHDVQSSCESASLLGG